MRDRGPLTLKYSGTDLLWSLCGNSRRRLISAGTITKIITHQPFTDMSISIAHPIYYQGTGQ
jgi:hypothetical protein